jgi:hypothetical protein
MGRIDRIRILVHDTVLFMKPATLKDARPAQAFQIIKTNFGRKRFVHGKLMFGYQAKAGRWGNKSPECPPAIPACRRGRRLLIKIITSFG